MSYPFIYEAKMPVSIPEKAIISSCFQGKTNGSKNKIMKAMENADRNEDGCFSKDELQQALKELGAICPRWRAFWAFRNADTNHDGQISGEEIKSLLQYLRSCGFGK
ncbi:unnamed protein product [Sphenostylis stenocarpa]|uniref:EF-hand domain-containing protein n=1 Tax=Sphenostylis stenocarpa TaxID=92480 RepID=A0AA86VPF6_9FABA|nr:unnamed protein product [Sphenostylis stenocarpa]